MVELLARVGRGRSQVNKIVIQIVSLLAKIVKRELLLE